MESNFMVSRLDLEELQWQTITEVDQVSFSCGCKNVWRLSEFLILCYMIISTHLCSQIMTCLINWNTSRFIYLPLFLQQNISLFVCHLSRSPCWMGKNMCWSTLLAGANPEAWRGNAPINQILLVESQVVEVLCQGPTRQAWSYYRRHSCLCSGAEWNRTTACTDLDIKVEDHTRLGPSHSERFACKWGYIVSSGASGWDWLQQRWQMLTWWTLEINVGDVCRTLQGMVSDIDDICICAGDNCMVMCAMTL